MITRPGLGNKANVSLDLITKIANLAAKGPMESLNFLVGNRKITIWLGLKMCGLARLTHGKSSQKYIKKERADKTENNKNLRSAFPKT